jgi:crotonobetainyl-CoA:carnitine CoA-transferase CaiB-like acyl-CoA transferase
MLIKRVHPSEGEIWDLRPANEVSSGHRQEWLPAPKLGQHTIEILKEAGLSLEEIEEMIAQGSAKVPEQS